MEGEEVITFDGHVYWFGRIGTVELLELFDSKRIVLGRSDICPWWLHDRLCFGGGLWLVVLRRRVRLCAVAKEVLLAVEGETRRGSVGSGLGGVGRGTDENGFSKVCEEGGDNECEEEGGEEWHSWLEPEA